MSANCKWHLLVSCWFHSEPSEIKKFFKKNSISTEIMNFFFFKKLYLNWVFYCHAGTLPVWNCHLCSVVLDMDSYFPIFSSPAFILDSKEKNHDSDKWAIFFRKMSQLGISHLHYCVNEKSNNSKCVHWHEKPHAAALLISLMCSTSSHRWTHSWNRSRLPTSIPLTKTNLKNKTKWISKKIDYIEYK